MKKSLFTILILLSYNLAFAQYSALHKVSKVKKNTITKPRGGCVYPVRPKLDTLKKKIVYIHSGNDSHKHGITNQKKLEHITDKTHHLKESSSHLLKKPIDIKPKNGICQHGI